MSEGEQPGPEVVDAENPTVTKVKGAVDGVWEKPSILQEYKDIRKEMQSRLDWHGGGVYRRWVNGIDLVSNTITAVNRKSILRKIFAKVYSGVGRLVAAPTSAAVAGLDILYNVATFPARKALPRNVVKRAFLIAVDTAVAGGTALVGAHGVGKATMEASIKGQKAVVETVITAPEVAVTMAKRRVDRVVNKIMHPQKA